MPRLTLPIAVFAFGTTIALAMSAASTAEAAGVAPAQSTSVQREQAQSRFMRGKEKFAKKDYEGALVEFNASLDIVSSPNTRLYVGRCLRELGRLVEAYAELGRTEIEAKELSRDDPRYANAGTSAHDERAKLEPKLGFVTVEVAHAEPNTTVKIGDQEIRRGGWSEPIPAMPGTVEVIAETPGRAPVRQSVEIAAAEKKSVSLDAREGALLSEAPKPDTGASTKASSSDVSLRNMAFVAGGAAVVGLGMFAFFGLKANSTHSDLEDACPGGRCPDNRDAQISEGRTQQTVANVGLVVFGVGAAAAVTLWVLGAPKKESAPKPDAAPTANASLRPTARVVASPSFVGLRGAF